jgi:hypothetical protein
MPSHFTPDPRPIDPPDYWEDTIPENLDEDIDSTWFPDRIDLDPRLY